MKTVPRDTSTFRRLSVLARALFLFALLSWAPGAAQAVTLFGLVDTGELYASTDEGASWAIRSTLPVHDAVALVAGATSSELYLASQGGSVYRSTDAGSNWTGVSAIPASDVTALVGSQGLYLLLASSGSVYRSTDAGANWTAVGAITASDLVSAAHRGSSWFALSATGGVYRSDDDGADWTAVGAIPTSEAVEIASFAGSLYSISASGDLYESADAGVSFTAVGTLSHVGTTTLVASTGELVACLGTGEAAASADASSWTWRGAINQLTVRALATDLPTTTGVGPRGPMALEFRSPWPNPASGAIRLGLELDRDARVTVTVHDAAGREVARPIDREPLAAGPTLRVWQPRGLAAGLYFLRARIGERAITRRLVWLGGE